MAILLRGHVNKKNSKNPKRLWKGVGGSSVQLDIKKNWKTYFYVLFPLVLASIQVYNVINAPLCHDCLL